MADLEDKIYLNELLHSAIEQYLLARTGNKADLRARIFKLGCKDTDEFCGIMNDLDEIMITAFGNSRNYDNIVSKVEYYMTNEEIKCGLDKLYSSSLKDRMFYKLDEFKRDIDAFAKSNGLRSCTDTKTINRKVSRGLSFYKI